jgi:hypothetical protein
MNAIFCKFMIDDLDIPINSPCIFLYISCFGGRGSLDKEIRNSNIGNCGLPSVAWAFFITLLYKKQASLNLAGLMAR